MEVGQIIKDKKRDKRVRDGDPSQKGSREGREVSKHQETFSLGGVCGEFWDLRGNITGRGKKSLQNMHLTATPSGEVAQTLASITSEQGLNREVQVACLG